MFGGEVESLTDGGGRGRSACGWSPTTVRVTRGRVRSTPSVIEETLRDARDNAAFGEPDEWYTLASPADVNGAVASSLDLWRDELAAVPTDEKVRIALDLDRATRAADPRIRNVEGTGYGDSLTEAALANSLGIEAASNAARRVRRVVERDRRRRLGPADRLRIRRGPGTRRPRPRVGPRRRGERARAGSSAPARSPAAVSR